MQRFSVLKLESALKLTKSCDTLKGLFIQNATTEDDFSLFYLDQRRKPRSV